MVFFISNTYSGEVANKQEFETCLNSIHNTCDVTFSSLINITNKESQVTNDTFLNILSL